MTVKTIDDLISELQNIKSSGISGDTAVAIYEKDINGKNCMAKFEFSVHLSAVSKNEFDKGFTLCRSVSRGGVKILLFS